MTRRYFGLGYHHNHTPSHAHTHTKVHAHAHTHTLPFEVLGIRGGDEDKTGGISDSVVSCSLVVECMGAHRCVWEQVCVCGWCRCVCGAGVCAGVVQVCVWGWWVGVGGAGVCVGVALVCVSRREVGVGGVCGWVAHVGVREWMMCVG